MNNHQMHQTTAFHHPYANLIVTQNTNGLFHQPSTNPQLIQAQATDGRVIIYQHISPHQQYQTQQIHAQQAPMMSSQLAAPHYTQQQMPLMASNNASQMTHQLFQSRQNAAIVMISDQQLPQSINQSHFLSGVGRPATQIIHPAMPMQQTIGHQQYLVSTGPQYYFQPMPQETVDSGILRPGMIAFVPGQNIQSPQQVMGTASSEQTQYRPQFNPSNPNLGMSHLQAASPSHSRHPFQVIQSPRKSPSPARPVDMMIPKNSRALGFFEEYLSHDKARFAAFELQKPTHDIISKWFELRNNINAQGQFIVSTNTWNLRTISLAHQYQVPQARPHAENYEWSGEPRLMTCILCNEYIFFFLNNPMQICQKNNRTDKGMNSDCASHIQQDSMVGDQGFRHSLKNGNPLPQGKANHLQQPNFFINAEFASIEILRNSTMTLKIGFILRLGQVQHQFIAVNPSQFKRQPRNFQTLLEDSQKSDMDPFQVQQVLNNNTQQNVAHQIFPMSKAPSAIVYASKNAKIPEISITDLQSTPEQNEAQIASQEIRELMRQWIRALNSCVIRTDDLRKYQILGQIGAGAQAKVYKIAKPQRNNPEHQQQQLLIMQTSSNPDANSCQSLNSLNPNDPLKSATKRLEEQKFLDESIQNFGQLRLEENPQPTAGNEKQRSAQLGSPERLTISQYPGLKLTMKNHASPGEPGAKYFAMKVICKKQLAKKSVIDKSQMINEIQFQRSLHLCGNIIHLNKIYESDKYLSLIMDFQEGGTLGDILEKQIRISEEDARVITAQILLTVDFMSRKGVVHRDLKPENILLSSKQDGVYEIKIADFGFAIPMFSAHAYNEKLRSAVCGTPGYIAPEALAGSGFNLKSDVFSVGSILFSILTLRNLFNGTSYQEIMEQNKICDLSNLDRQTQFCSTEARDLLKLMLSKDVKKRPKAIQALNHPWFINEKLPLESSMHINKVITAPNFNINQVNVAEIDQFQNVSHLSYNKVQHGNLPEFGDDKNPFSCENPVQVVTNHGRLGMSNEIKIQETKIQTMKETNMNGLEPSPPILRPSRQRAAFQKSSAHFEEEKGNFPPNRGVSHGLRHPIAHDIALGSGVIHRSPSNNTNRSNSQVNYYKIISEYKQNVQQTSLNRSQSPIPQFSGFALNNTRHPSAANNPHHHHVIIGGSQALHNSSKNGFSAAATQKDQGASIQRVEGSGFILDNQRNTQTLRGNKNVGQGVNLTITNENRIRRGPNQPVPGYGASDGVINNFNRGSELNMRWGAVNFKIERRDSNSGQEQNPGLIADTSQAIIDQNMRTLNNQQPSQYSQQQHQMINEGEKNTKTVKALPGLDELIIEQHEEAMLSFQLPQFGRYAAHQIEEQKAVPLDIQLEPKDTQQLQQYIKEQQSFSAQARINSRLHHLAERGGPKESQFKEDGASSGSLGADEVEGLGVTSSEDQRKCFMFLKQNVTREIAYMTGPLRKEQTRKLILQNDQIDEEEALIESDLHSATDPHQNTQKQGKGPSMMMGRMAPPKEQKEVFLHQDMAFQDLHLQIDNPLGNPEGNLVLGKSGLDHLNFEEYDLQRMKQSQGMSVFACTDENEDGAALVPEKRWAHLMLSKQHHRVNDKKEATTTTDKTKQVEKMPGFEKFERQERRVEGRDGGCDNSDQDNTQQSSQGIDLKRFMQGLNVAKVKRVFL